MTITPPAPQPRTSVATWKLDSFSVRVYDKSAVLQFGAYDASGDRVNERRFSINESTLPGWQQFVAACPAGSNFKNQIEAFAASLAAELGGTVS